MRQESYLVHVDAHNNWTPCTYREVTADELDKILEAFGNKIMRICSNGKNGAMTMWACFKSRINGGCYHDMINAYRLLSDDSKDLVTREHELRHLWNQYEELWRIRYYGTVENFYLQRAKESKEELDKYYTSKLPNKEKENQNA